jgi:hypothetical protein
MIFWLIFFQFSGYEFFALALRFRVSTAFRAIALSLAFRAVSLRFRVSTAFRAMADSSVAVNLNMRCLLLRFFIAPPPSAAP